MKFQGTKGEFLKDKNEERRKEEMQDARAGRGRRLS
jgi:hypothetical protein